MKMKTRRPKIFKPKTKTNQPTYFLLISYISILLFINGVSVAVIFSILSLQHSNTHLNLPPYSMALSIILSSLNIMSLWALLKWKKWGFWGYCATTIASIPLSVYLGAPWAKASLGLIAIFILYSLYQVGGKKKAWNKLI